jgi:hypothetical protein
MREVFLHKTLKGAWTMTRSRERAQLHGAVRKIVPSPTPINGHQKKRLFNAG